MAGGKKEEFIQSIYDKLGMKRTVFTDAEIELRIKDIPNSNRFKFYMALSDDSEEFAYKRPSDRLAIVAKRFSSCPSESLIENKINNEIKALTDMMWNIHRRVIAESDEKGVSSSSLFKILDVKASGKFSDREMEVLNSGVRYSTPKEFIEKINLFQDGSDLNREMKRAFENAESYASSSSSELGVLKTKLLSKKEN